MQVSAHDVPVIIKSRSLAPPISASTHAIVLPAHTALCTYTFSCGFSTILSQGYGEMLVKQFVVCCGMKSVDLVIHIQVK